MGLIRYAQPKSGSAAIGAQWTLFPSGAGSDGYLRVDDPIGTVDVRGSGGAVTTSLADDNATYIRPTNNNQFHGFTFGPITGDDDLMHLIFHIRAVNLGGTDQAIDIVHRHSAVNYFTPFTILGTTSSYTEHNVTIATDPATGAAWDVTELAAGAEFGFRVSVFSSAIRITRFYVEARFAVGPTLGRDYREDNWRYCDVCGTKHPYSRLQRPAAPHPQTGLVVCPRCYDQPDHDTLKIMSGRHPYDEQDTLY